MNETWELIIDWIGNDYTHTIIDKTLEFCQSRGISVVVATVGHLSYTLESEAFDRFFLPVTAWAPVCRYLLAASQISSHGGRLVLEKHFLRLGSKPMVSLGSSLGPVPVVKANIRIAFEQLLEHLYSVHGYRRFAWVGGAEDNLESQERLRIFRKFIGQKELTLDPGLILHGNFTYNSGKKAGQTLSGRRADWDVVIAANDTMAVALREILGANTPLTGFDDSTSASEHGFTTVNPRLSEVTELGLLRLQNAGPETESCVYDSPSVEAEFVLRSSCGCPNATQDRRSKSPFDQSTERIGVIAQNIMGCSDMEDLELYLNNTLPNEGVRFWRLLPMDGANREIPREFIGVPGSTIIIQALCLNADLYGFLVLDLQSRDYAFAEWLRVHVTLLIQSWHKRSEGILVQKTLSLEIEKLERRRTDIESVVNSLPVLVAELDRQLRIRYLNRAGAVLLGISAPNTRNLFFPDFADPRDRDLIQLELAHCRDFQEAVSVQFGIKNPLGENRSVACRIEPLPAVRSVNLSTLFGSMRFEGGVRLTGLQTRDLTGHSRIDESFFQDFGFSLRQKELLQCLSEGLSTAQTAARMKVSQATVRVQIHHIYTKTGVLNRQTLIRLIEDYRIRKMFR